LAPDIFTCVENFYQPPHTRFFSSSFFASNFDDFLQESLQKEIDNLKNVLAKRKQDLAEQQLMQLPL
jgi:hypothetical protein